MIGHYINVSFSRLFPTCFSSPFLKQVRSLLSCGWLIFPDALLCLSLCMTCGAIGRASPARVRSFVTPSPLFSPSLSLYSCEAEGTECERLVSRKDACCGDDRGHLCREDNFFPLAWPHNPLQPLPQRGLGWFLRLCSQVWRWLEWFPSPIGLSIRYS